MKRGSKGGQIMAIRQRKEALERYYQNPNICMCCGKIIDVLDNQKVGEVRKKKFCNQSCNAKHNNRLRPKKIKIKREKILIDRTNKTKEDLKEEKKNIYQYHAYIRSNSRTVYFKNKNKRVCEKCGYDKHIEVCHKRPIKEFDDTHTIKEINDINNLIGLCPNCHWEMDHMREGQVTQCVS